MKKRAHRAFLRCAGGLTLVLCLVLRADGQQYLADGFDDDAPKWSAQFLPLSEQSRTRVFQHRRESSDWKRSGSAEVLRLKTLERNQSMILSYSLPPARPFEDLKLSLKTKSNQEGLQLAVRVVFADHLNPRTGKPLTSMIRGDVYRTGGAWRELVCAVNRLGVERALRELRTTTSLPLDSPGLTYVDQALLLCDLNPGNIEIAIDDLKFGPIISPLRLASTDEEPVIQVSGTKTKSAALKSRAEMRLGRLRVDGRPFFPRMTAWHPGDSVAELKRAGFNTVWIDDLSNAGLLQELADAGMYAVAVPPAPPTQSSTHLVSTTTTKLTTDNPHLLFWYLGTRVAPREQKKLVHWSKWLRATDPMQRPLMVDVTAAERLYSRHVNLLGLSRPVLGTSISLRDYRNTLLQRRAMAQPGKFMWTWVQADVPEAQIRREGTPYVLEPEQLRLQTYASIAAGSKAVGFWTKTPLNSDRPGDEERRLMAHQLNLELGLIEDWLATGELAGSVSCKAGTAVQSRGSGTMAKAYLAARNRKSQAGGTAPRVQKTNVETAIINTNKGKLLLPVWYSESAQFVPSELVAKNLSMVVHVPDAERTAWLVTTTGMRTLSTAREGGGLRIDLWTADQQTLFDQTAMIVITSREDAINELRSKIAAVAADSAQTSIQLAKAKLERVRRVEETIAAADGRSQTTINSAYRMLASAEASAETANYHSARRQAQNVMRLLRRLQHTRWKAATSGLSSAASSPHTVSYQTLPDHYAMIEHLKSVQPTRVAQLLPSVTGSEVGSLESSGWRRFTGQSDSIRKEAQFIKSAKRYSLAMVAAPTDRKQASDIVTETPIRVTSPILHLEKGETAYVTGRIKIPATIRGNVNGAMLFDSIGGPAGSLRWRTQTNGWVQFDLLREAAYDTPFYLTFLLSGFGQMQVADLEVVVYPSRTP